MSKWVKAEEDGLEEYEVILSYSIKVKAKDASEAERNARADWDDIMPRSDEMNVEVLNFV